MRRPGVRTGGGGAVPRPEPGRERLAPPQDRREGAPRLAEPARAAEAVRQADPRVVPGVEPFHEIGAVPPREATAKLRAILTATIAEPADVAVRFTAGGGKTTLTAELIDELLPPGKVVFFAVPTLKLAREVAAKFGNRKVKVIEGRSPGNCDRYELVEELGKLGLPIRPFACDPHSKTEEDDTPAVHRDPRGCGKCPFFESCRYEAQFREKADVYIFAHNYLYLPKRKELPDPDLIVIDESFLGHATRSVKIEAGELVSVSSKAKQTIQAAEEARLERDREGRAEEEALAAGTRAAERVPWEEGEAAREEAFQKAADEAYARVMAEPRVDIARHMAARPSPRVLSTARGRRPSARDAKKKRDAVYASARVKGREAYEARTRPEFCKVVLDALAAGLPLLTALRAKGFTAEAVRKIATEIAKPFRRQFADAPNPAADVALIKKALGRFRRLPALYYLARELAKELEGGAERSTAVVMAEAEPGDGGPPRQLVRVRWGEAMRLKGPVLILDATGDGTILEALRPGIAFHAIDIERKARFVQVVDTKLTKRSLTKDKSAARNLERVQAAVDRLAGKHARGLIVTHMPVEKSFKVPEGWKIAHFGAIRGIDELQGPEHGRHRRPAAAAAVRLEDQAAALARLAGREVGGEWVSGHRGLTMRDGTGVGVLAAWHTDELVEACRRQACEAELLQAVDRLRLVDHDGTLKERTVYLLTSVPLPLPIDEVTTLDALAGEDRLAELLERFGAVPLSAPWLHERAPDLFATEMAAKRWVREGFKGPDGLRYIQANRTFEIGEYRAAGRAGGKAVRFVVRRDHPMPRAALEAVAGELAHYKGPPDRPKPSPANPSVVPIDAAFLADLRPLAPGSDILAPAVLLDPARISGGNP